VAGHTQTHDAHAHGDHGDHGDHGEEEHGLAHIASKKILLTIGGILLFLTVVTVAATRVDFGSQMNLVVALFIATVKATLVAMFFMHLRYDKPFHTVIIAAGLLAALLFVGFAFMDGDQYQRDVCEEPGASCVTWQAAITAHEQAEAERAAPSSDPGTPGQPAPGVTPAGASPEGTTPAGAAPGVAPADPAPAAPAPAPADPAPAQPAP
jgi:cytochrome c oxidase subunit 4